MSTHQALIRKVKTPQKAWRTAQFQGAIEESHKPSESVCDDFQVRIAARAH